MNNPSIKNKRKRGRPPKLRPPRRKFHTVVYSADPAENQELRSKVKRVFPDLPGAAIDGLVVAACHYIPLNKIRAGGVWKGKSVGNRSHIDMHLLIVSVAEVLASTYGKTPKEILQPIGGSYDEQLSSGKRNPCEADRVIRGILKLLGQHNIGSLRQQVRKARQLL